MRESVNNLLINPPQDLDSQSDVSSVSHCLFFQRSTGQLIGEVDLQWVSETLEEKPDSFVWISLLRPSAALLAQVKEEFNLHELAIEDASRQHQRTKIESYGDTLFVVLKTIKQAQTLHFGATYVFLAERYIISIRQNNTLSESAIAEMCVKNTHKLKQGPGFIFHAIMDYIVDQYAPVIEQFDEQLQALEHYIFSDKFSRRTLKNLYYLKQELTHFRLAVAPMQEVCNFFIIHKQTETANYISKQSIPYFRDIQDHVLTTLDVSNSQSEMLKVAMDTYLALVSMSQSEVVKRLASWAGILAVPTLVASIYGMNFAYMPELQWHYGYFMAIGFMLLICITLYYRFKKASWL
jgi:magnesium transporter